MFSFKVVKDLADSSAAASIRIPGGENFPLDATSFTDTISTMMILPTIEGRPVLFQVGHGKLGILCDGIISSGPDGLMELRAFARACRSSFSDALQQVQGAEAAYFEALLKDSTENGLDMPFHGVISLDD